MWFLRTALPSLLLGFVSLALPCAAQSVDLADSIKAHTKTKLATPSKAPPPRATKPKPKKVVNKAHAPNATSTSSKTKPAPAPSERPGTVTTNQSSATKTAEPSATSTPASTPAREAVGVGGTPSRSPSDIAAPPIDYDTDPSATSAPSPDTGSNEALSNGATNEAPSSAAPTTERAAPPEASAKPASRLQLAMFVDAYAAWQTSGSGTLATLSGHRAYSGQGATLRAENGFSLAFFGFDATYDAGSFGAVANLRFGEGAPIYHYHATGESDLGFGVEHLTQAYAFWHPLPVLELDLGMFSTPFGAEVLESWRDANYTRGALYYYAQPAWHTGFKAKWDLGAVSLIGFIADGTNNLSETQQNSGLDQTPTLGAQAVYTPNEALSFALGGLFTLDGYHNDDAGFDAFLDLLATLKLGSASVSFNADTVLTRNGAPDGTDRHFWGCSLIAGYALTDNFALALRGEYLHDDANYGGGNEWKLGTATFTADYKPIPDLPNLIVRWDNRWEKSNQHIFGLNAKGTADTSDDSYTNAWFESVIGVVVTTAP